MDIPSPERISSMGKGKTIKASKFRLTRGSSDGGNFNLTDVGKLVVVRQGTVLFEKVEWQVQWIGPPPGNDETVKISKVEPQERGTVKLENGSKFENPGKSNKLLAGSDYLEIKHGCRGTMVQCVAFDETKRLASGPACD